MTVVKTAISLKKPLFQKLEALAAELELSRSKVLAIALEEYIERRDNMRILKELNAAYGDEQEEERELGARHAVRYRDFAEDSW